MRLPKFPLHILLLLLGVFFLAASLLPLQNVSEEEAILNMMKVRDRAVKEVLGPEGTDYTGEQRQRLKDLINDIIDFQEMARFALESQWEQLTAEQRSKFVETFSEVVRRSSLKKLDIFRAVIEYKDVRVESGRAEVQTQATYKKTRSSVSYSFVKKGDSWAVADFSIDDVSTADSYRRSFKKIIRKHSFEGLMDRLKKKLEEE